MKEARAILDLHRAGLTSADRPDVAQALYDKAKEIIAMRYMLEQCAAALDSCVIHHGHHMSATVALACRAMIDEANEFLEQNK